MADMEQISQQLQAGEVEKVTALVQAALDEGVEAEAILNQPLLKGMNIIGEKFKVNEIFVPDVIFAGRSMTSAMKLLQPHLAEKGIEPMGRVLIGTVKGDLHDIGKNLVAMLLEGAGFTVTDLGNDVSPEAFVKAAKDEGPCIVGMSALLTTTMPVMAAVVEQIKAEGLKDVKTMIGGAPVTKGFAGEIGADGYAPDAGSATDLAKELFGVGA